MTHNTLKRTMSLLLVICMMASFAGCISDADIFFEGFRMGAMIILDILLPANPKRP